jgi:hypothetical protein
MNGSIEKNPSIGVYKDLREKDREYFWIRNRKSIILDIIKTLAAAFLGTVLFPVGIIFFFYFYQNKPKIYSFFILAVTLAFSNLVPLIFRLYYLLLEAIEFSKIYT